MEDDLPGPLLPTLSKVAVPVLKALSAKLLEQTFLEKAIVATAEIFPDVAVSTALRAWCKSDGFSEILDRFVNKGERELADAAIVESFIKASGFYFGDGTSRRATELLETFFERVAEALYSSDKAMPALANRLEYVGAEILSKVDRLLIDRTPNQQALPAQAKDAGRIARIDAAKDLVNQGRPKGALAILKPLEEELRAGTLDGQLAYRVVMNLGAISTMANEYAQAHVYFSSALVYKADDAKALANLAQLALLQNREDEALDLVQRARKADPQNLYVAAILIWALDAKGKSKEMTELVAADPPVLKDAQCTVILGELAYRANDYDTAIAHAQNAFELDPTMARASDLIGRTQLAVAQRSLKSDVPLPWRLPADDRERLHQADLALTRAVGLLEAQEDSAALAGVLTNRGVARMMLGATNDALADFDRSLMLAPQLDLVRCNKGRLLIGEGRFPEAITALESVTDESAIAIAAYPLATAYVLGHKPRNALPLLERLRQNQSEPGSRAHISGLLLQAYHQLGKNEAAAATLESLEAEMPNDIDALMIVGEAKDLRGDHQGALAAYEKARSLAHGPHKDVITLGVADLHLRNRRYGEAADAYLSIVDSTSVTPITGRYLFAAVKAGRFQEALDLCQRIRAATGIVAEITEFEVSILEYSNELTTARGLLLELTERDPANAIYRLRTAEIEFRLGARNRAAAIVKELADSELAGHPELLLQAARLRAWLDLPEVLPLAYRALIAGFDNPDIHLGYISLFLGREKADDAQLEKEVVGTDCTVHLRRGEEHLVYTIVASAPNPALNEIAANNPIAASLLGKRDGDAVVLKQSVVEELCYEVKEIQSKYVFGFQDAIAKFSRRFPTHSGISSMEFDPSDTTKLLSVLDTRAQIGSDATEKYYSQRLPMAVLASLVGRDVAEVWEELSSRDSGQVITSSGDPKEMDEQLAALAESKAVALDVTCLLGLRAAGVLERLPEAFDHVRIAQPVADEIAGKLLELSSGLKPAGTLQGENHHIRLYDAAPEDIERYKQDLDAIHKFIYNKGELAPTPQMLAQSVEELEQMRRVFGAGTSGVIHVARGEHLPLCADDAMLRALAKNSWGVRGAGSQAILLRMRDEDLITVQEYNAALVRLVMANYKTIFINADILMWALEEYQLAPTPEVVKLFSLFAGPECDENSAVFAMAHLTRQVWLKVTLPQSRELILDQIIRTLAAGRTVSVFKKFDAAIRELFHLYTIAQRTILTRVLMWLKTRSLKK
jgi:tetratricopeptide (TPR) repeat protein